MSHDMGLPLLLISCFNVLFGISLVPSLHLSIQTVSRIHFLLTVFPAPHAVQSIQPTPRLPLHRLLAGCLSYYDRELHYALLHLSPADCCLTGMGRQS